MSLLTDLLADPLDRGYAEAAARRGGRPGRPAGAALLLGLVVIGLLLATAAAQVRSRGGESGSGRSALVAEVEQRTAATDRLAAEVADLRAEITAFRRAGLASSDAAALAERLALLEVRSGAVPVAGPGVAVTVDDAESVDSAAGSDPRDVEQADEGRVQDGDLQRVVNGLWAAGAEAVAINGQRLTALTAIRSANIAILVAYRPLSPPYVISAVGDPGSLETRLREGDAGLYLDVLRDAYGIRSSVEPVEELRLPAASGLTLRAAALPPSGQETAP